MAGRSGGRCGHRGAVFDVLYRPGAVHFAVVSLQLRLLWAAQKAGPGVLGRLGRGGGARDVTAGGGLYPVARNKRPGHVHQRGRRPRAAVGQRRLDYRAAASLLCGGRTDAALIDDRHAPIPHPHHADAVGALCHPRALFNAPLDRLRHHRRGGGYLRRRLGAHG